MARAVPAQVPDPDPGLVPAADRQPAAVRADGDRGHAAILAAVEGRRPAPGRVRMAGIDEQDPGIVVIDQRQSPMIGQPGRFCHLSAVSLSNSGGPTRIASGPRSGSGRIGQRYRPHLLELIKLCPSG